MREAPLIARMDADDIALPERFERQMARMAPSPTCWCLGPRPSGSTPGATILASRAAVEPDERGTLLLRANPIAHPTVVMRRDAVGAVGGYREAYLRAEDYDLWLRLAEHGKLANCRGP